MLLSLTTARSARSALYNYRSHLSMSSSSSSSSIEPSADRRKELRESLETIRSRINASASPNKTTTTTLVAVSKYKPPSDILGCYQEGHLDFGENYVQELADKARMLPSDIRWHFIGTLQSNKAKALAAIPNLYCVHTLGSIKAANALNKALPDERPASSSPLRVLLQVNTSGEDSKSGLPPLPPPPNLLLEDAPLVSVARHVVTECPKLRLVGLMTIGSLDLSSSSSSSSSADADQKNADFERLKRTRDLLSDYLDKSSFAEGKSRRRWGDDDEGRRRRLALSMGMTGDFEVAVRAGSDVVRVGSGIFGLRDSTKKRDA